MRCGRMHRNRVLTHGRVWRRCMALSVLAAGVARAVEVPECDAEVKALVDRRYAHWANADMQGALAIASDSIVIRIDTANRIRFFDGARYGAQMRQCDRLAEWAARDDCVNDVRTEVAAPSRITVEAAVRLREHNASGPTADIGTAERLRRVCKQGIWVLVPYNRGGLVSARSANATDPATAMCMGGATFVTDWRNWTHDGGRTWSLRPSFGFCPTKADRGVNRIPPPPPPSRLQHARPGRTP
jgi:hypothetical protein